MGECWGFAPHVGAILVALVRGLNDPDYDIRVLAIKGPCSPSPALRPRSRAC